MKTTILIVEDEKTKMCIRDRIPMDRQVTGVCIQNAKYPLQNATLVRGSTLSVSNEPLQGPVTVSVEQGAVLFLFTKE